jgi:hypothetical protein
MVLGAPFLGDRYRGPATLMATHGRPLDWLCELRPMEE